MKKMQMRLMSGVATVLFPLFSSHAQVCTPTPDCATMGYNKTEEQCVGLSVVRCPYDINKLFVPTARPAVMLMSAIFCIRTVQPALC